ncbi:hypothetical protein ACH5RR_032637 [Cinchona calisaya]|uniref:Reverse transcriptase zinc-binding domain-containing protein n=1 Tax=Cinchona calisaya TaxID=153742 RepID=A0ABD2YM65_9GENT
MKHNWNIFKKNDSLWIVWVHVIKLKNQSFWAVKTPIDCSWFWRKLLILWGIVRPTIEAVAGNGKDIFLWFDKWYPKGPLLDVYGADIMKKFGSNTSTKLESIIQDGEWIWPTGRKRNAQVLELIESLKPCVPIVNGEDDFKWIHESSGQFTTATAMKLLSSSMGKVPWFHVVCFPKHVPRFSFILWLVCKIE